MNQRAHFNVTNLVKSYGKNKVLDVKELNLKSGQFFALMGKNGSGKSTLMRLLAQQELFYSGEILFNAQSLRLTSLKLNDHVAFISEEQELPFAEPLSYWRNIHAKLYPNYDGGLFDRLCKALEVDPTKSFHGMSRGQKMKALFCIQAPKKPSIYLLDEITSVLDQGSRWALMEFLDEEVKRGCLVVMSTNIASEMQGFATNVTIIENGVVKFDSDSQTLNAIFRKVLVPKGAEASVSALSAKRIGMNSDGTWIYLHPRDKASDHPGVIEDQRAITISDIQSYFTAGEHF